MMIFGALLKPKIHFPQFVTPKVYGAVQSNIGLVLILHSCLSHDSGTCMMHRYRAQHTEKKTRVIFVSSLS